MEKKKWMQKKGIWAVVALCLAFAIFAAAYLMLRQQSVSGSKNIVVEIITGDDRGKAVDIKTDAEFLRQALEEKNLIKGDESGFGLFVHTVDGITVDSSKQEWWCFTRSGESIMTGVDFIPIADGEHYEITLKAGY